MCTVAGWGLEGRHENRGSPTEVMGKLRGRVGPSTSSVSEKGMGSLPLRAGSRLGICLGEGDSLSALSRHQAFIHATASPAQEAAPSGPPGCSPAPPPLTPIHANKTQPL